MQGEPQEVEAWNYLEESTEGEEVPPEVQTVLAKRPEGQAWPMSLCHQATGAPHLLAGMAQRVHLANASLGQCRSHSQRSQMVLAAYGQW